MKKTLFLLLILLGGACSPTIVERPDAVPSMYPTRLEGSIGGESFAHTTHESDWGYSFWEENTSYAQGTFTQRTDVYHFTHDTHRYRLEVNLANPYQRGSIIWTYGVQPPSDANWVALECLDTHERFTPSSLSGEIQGIRKWLLSRYRTGYYIEGRLHETFTSTTDATHTLQLDNFRFHLPLIRF